VIFLLVVHEPASSHRKAISFSIGLGTTKLNQELPSINLLAEQQKLLETEIKFS